MSNSKTIGFFESIGLLDDKFVFKTGGFLSLLELPLSAQEVAKTEKDKIIKRLNNFEVEFNALVNLKDFKDFENFKNSKSLNFVTFCCVLVSGDLPPPPLK